MCNYENVWAALAVDPRLFRHHLHMKRDAFGWTAYIEVLYDL